LLPHICQSNVTVAAAVCSRKYLSWTGHVSRRFHLLKLPINVAIVCSCKQSALTGRRIHIPQCRMRCAIQGVEQADKPVGADKDSNAAGAKQSGEKATSQPQTCFSLSLICASTQQLAHALQSGCIMTSSSFDTLSIWVRMLLCQNVNVCMQ